MNPIGGMNVAIVWIPPPMPPARIVTNHSGEPTVVNNSPKPSTKRVPAKISKKSMKAPPILIVTHKHQVHGHQENGNAHRPVEHDSVNLVRQGFPDAVALFHRLLGQPVDSPVAAVGQQDIGFFVEFGFDFLLMTVRALSTPPCSPSEAIRSSPSSNFNAV